MKILDTARLALRLITIDDAPFYLRLVNDPAWLQFIGNKGVRSVADARQAILDGPVAMQLRCGFSLYLCELKDSATPIGLCGLIKRDSLADVDIGFAFLPEFCGSGYGYEAAAAVLQYANQKLGIERLVAITKPDNRHSIRLLERLGMVLQHGTAMSKATEQINLYARDLVVPKSA